MELYIHIPFCIRKCAYCDFLSFPAARKVQEQYVEMLLREIRTFQTEKSVKEECEAVSSVFFGGGTPSLLPAEQIARIMETVRGSFVLTRDAEISIECNPGTADEEKFRIYRAAGINRLSFGLQSANNQELALLGRIHTWEQFCKTYEAARRAGFSNINIDLMSSLPGQSVDSWCKTVKSVLALQPQHISAYSLIIEEGTPFYERYAEDALRRDAGEDPMYLPSEDAERRMYEVTEELLAQAGMHRYEISNYALPGCECRHNVGYWTGVPYSGFGLGAASYLPQKDKAKAAVRYKNTECLETYLSGDFAKGDCEELDVRDQMEEFMFLGLRMIEGVEEESFLKRFGRSIDEVYGTVLERQIKLGLLRRDNGRIFLSERGLDLGNEVMAEFLF